LQSCGTDADRQNALANGMVIIIKGTTTRCVAEEITGQKLILRNLLREDIRRKKSSYSQRVKWLTT